MSAAHGNSLGAQAFSKIKDCDTAALCNKLVGECTTATCQPNKTACQGNTLTKCNSDGTAFASMMDCSPGTCDMSGGDCNKCEPGQKTCQADAVLTCDATGQTQSQSACPNGGKCIGTGQCVQCKTNADCSSLTRGCKVGVCSIEGKCSAQNAPDRTTSCSLLFSSGVCSNGACVGCIDNTECGGTSGTPICEPLLHTCVECTLRAGCTTGQRCSGNTCVAVGTRALVEGPNCGQGYILVGAGFCTKTCSTTADCPESNPGTVCQSGACNYFCTPATNTDPGVGCPTGSHCPNMFTCSPCEGGVCKD